MGDKHPSIVQQTMQVSAIALGTLGGRSSVVLFGLTGLTATFLMHRYRLFIQLIGRTADDDGPLLIGIAKGDATTTEINAAMIAVNTVGPGDTTQMLTQDNAWVVYQNTVVPVLFNGDGLQGQPTSDWVKFGGKNGIPATEGTGFLLFAYNAGSGALTTGQVLNGLAHIQGRWLRD